MGDENRRDAKRYEVWFPLEVHEDEGRRFVAISHDMSEKGIRVATADPLEAGQTVRLTFTLSGRGGAEQTVEGVILRVEPKGGEPHLWRYQAAIQFDTPHGGIEDLLAELSQELPWATRSNATKSDGSNSDD